MRSHIWTHSATAGGFPGSVKFGGGSETGKAETKEGALVNERHALASDSGASAAACDQHPRKRKQTSTLVMPHVCFANGSRWENSQDKAPKVTNVQIQTSPERKAVTNFHDQTTTGEVKLVPC